MPKFKYLTGIENQLSYQILLSCDTAYAELQLNLRALLHVTFVPQLRY